MSEKKRQDKKSFKTEFKEPTPSSKVAQASRAVRMNQIKQIRQNKLDSVLLQKRGIIDKDGESTINSINATNLTALIDFTEYVQSPKLIVLVALNAECDLKKLAEEIYKMFDPSQVSIRGNVFTGIVPNDIVKGKERLTFAIAERDIPSCLDYCKVADMILFVSSSKGKHDLTKLNIDPYTSVDCIDMLGYDILSAIRSQGMLPHLCLIQDLDIIEDKHKSDFKKLYTRYFETELMPIKILGLTKEDEYKALLRTVSLSSTFEDTYNLRKHRTYMLCDNYYPEPSKTNSNETNLVVEGYVKGNTLNNLNYAHLTGFGDYIILVINDEINDPCPISKHGGVVSVKHPHKQKENLDINMENIVASGSKAQAGHQKEQIFPEANLNAQKTGNNQPVIIDDDYKVNKINKIEKENLENELNKGIEDLIDFDIGGKEEDISYHEEDEEKQDIITQAYSNKHEAKTSVYYRTPDDMEVPDEVDTPTDIPCRERFAKYRGLSSMATGSLDPTINLPKEYSNIYSFENIKHTAKESIKNSHEHGLRISGKYVKVILKNFKEFHLLDKARPLVLSTLLEHERKLCVMHLKIKQADDFKEPIYSKQLNEIQIGFRRILARPTFSKIVNDTDKLKKERKLEKGKFMIATLFCQLTFPGAPVIFLRPKAGTTELVATGSVVNSDCNKVILKKIVLTGYPLKIHKRKSVVRYMFFNPEDVNYFKPIPLVTKFGLRGNIIESLGTHGYMKCTFSDSLKQNDTICMPLYKRVFPLWFPESWRFSVGYSNDPKYIEIFSKDAEEFALKEAARYKVIDEDANEEDNDKMNLDA